MRAERIAMAGVAIARRSTEGASAVRRGRRDEDDDDDVRDDGGAASDARAVDACDETWSNETCSNDSGDAHDDDARGGVITMDRRACVPIQEPC